VCVCVCVRARARACVRVGGLFPPHLHLHIAVRFKYFWKLYTIYWSICFV